MSKFLLKINEFLGGTPNPKKQKSKQVGDDTLSTALNRVQTDPKGASPDEVAAAKAYQIRLKKQVKKLKEPIFTKSKKVKGRVVQEADPVPVPGEDPAAPPAGADPAAAPAPAPAQADAPPMTQEGEAMLVEMARLALHVNIHEVDLTEEERSASIDEVTPENAIQAGKLIQAIIDKSKVPLAGEDYDTRIDYLLQDLKKNDRNEAHSDEVIVLVPGSFKPPHKGHYEMIKRYAEMYPDGQIQVIISAPKIGGSERRTKDNKVIAPSDAEKIFELYLQGETNVDVRVGNHSSPVTVAYESLKDLAVEHPGATIVLGASSKDNDWTRWKDAQSWVEKEGLDLNVIDPAESAVDVTTKPNGEPYSASNIRANFDDFNKVKEDLPDHIVASKGSLKRLQRIFADIA